MVQRRLALGTDGQAVQLAVTFSPTAYCEDRPVISGPLSGGAVNVNFPCEDVVKVSP